MRINEKTVWITGASSGIGEELAYGAAAKQCTLILSSRKLDELNRVKAKCDSLGAKEVFVIKIDLAKSASIETAYSEFQQLNRPVDILINNGGISQRGKTFDTDMSVDRRIIEINYFGAVHLTKLVGAQMQHKGGVIAFTSSVVGVFGFPLRSAYSASKHAIHGFADALRSEYVDKNIQVTVVCPGRVKTNVSVNALEADGTKHGKMDAGQEKGISAERCAQLYWRGIEKGKKEVYIARGELVLIYLRRFIPALFYKFVTQINPK